MGQPGALQRPVPQIAHRRDVQLARPHPRTREQVVGIPALLHLRDERFPGSARHRHVRNAAHRLGIRQMHHPVLQIDLFLAHRDQLPIGPQPHLHHDHDDVAQVRRCKGFQPDLLRGAQIVRLARRARQGDRKLHPAARIDRQPLLLYRHVQDAAQDAELLMHGGRFELAAQLQPQLGVHPFAGVQSVHQVRFDLLRGDVRESVRAEPRSEELQRAEVLLMGLLAPEGRLGAVRKEPVRPLVEADPTVRRGARRQPFIASHQPLTQQPGVFHGFLPTPSSHCAYTVLGVLLSLATPTPSPLDGRVS